MKPYVFFILKSEKKALAKKVCLAIHRAVIVRDSGKRGVKICGTIENARTTGKLRTMEMERNKHIKFPFRLTLNKEQEYAGKLNLQ